MSFLLLSRTTYIRYFISGFGDGKIYASMYIYHDNTVCCLTFISSSYYANLNTLYLFKYINGKPDFKCTYRSTCDFTELTLFYLLYI